MLTSFAASLAFGLVAQIPPPKTPPALPALRVGPSHTYLLAAGKPMLEVSLPPALGTKTGPPRIAAGPIVLRMNLDGNVVRWLQADNTNVFDGTLLTADAMGKTLQAVDIRRTTVTSIAFEALSRSAGGSPVIAITLTPTSVVANKSTFPRPMIRAEAPMRIMGFEATIGGKAAPWIDRLLPFQINFSGTQFSTSLTAELTLDQAPSKGTVATGQISLRLQAMARPETRLDLDLKSVTVTDAGPRRASIRVGQIGFN